MGKGGGRCCAISSCKNYSTKTEGIVYHVFPKDKIISGKWIQICGKTDTFITKNKQICSIHFTAEDYERDLRNELLNLPLRKMLKSDAVPSLYLPSDIKSSEPTENQIEVVAEEQECIEHEIDRLEIGEAVVEIGENKENLNEEVLLLRAEIKSLKEKHLRFKRNSLLKIKSLYSQVKYYKSKRKVSPSPSHTKKKIQEILSGVLSPKQIEIVLRKKKRVVWAEEDISTAFTLRYYSKKAYLYLRDKLKYPLPSLSTLRRWASHIKMNLGILPDVLNIMQLAGEKSTELERTVVLEFDEMKVRSLFEYDVATDSVLGEHSQMQVVMARGLFGKWKQPVYCAFDAKMTKDILFEVISALHKINYSVVACTSDCGGGNIGLWKELGISIESTYFLHPNTQEKIYMFADAPHLLKLIRNWLLDTGFQLGDGTIIDKTPLEYLINLTDHEVNPLYKISRKHIEVVKTKRQNVRVAAQLMSHSTATALRRYQPGPDKQLALNLADFIENVNMWFDIFNSYSTEAKIDTKRPFGVNLEQQLIQLKELYCMFRDMRAKGKKQGNGVLQIFQKGILISIESLQLLFQDMKNKYEIKYICTYKLNQDCLENFFFQIRSRGGFDDHPTPLHAIQRIRLIILGKNPGILHSEANTEDQTTEEYMTANVFEKMDLGLSESAIAPDEEAEDNNLIIDNDSGSISSQSSSNSSQRKKQEISKDALEYIAGYLAWKYKETHPLLGDHTYKLVNVHDYDLPSWVQQLSYGGLIKPTNKWMKQVKKMNQLFLNYHGENFKKEYNTVANLSRLIEKSEKIPFKIVKTFIKLRLMIRIKYKNLKKLELIENKKRKSMENSRCESSRVCKKIKKIVT